MIENKQKSDMNLTKQTSRRSLFKKAAIGIPVVLTLANRPAYGAICSISGFQSVNPSGVQLNTGSGCGGFSPGGWKHPDNGQGATDANRSDWEAAGCNPNPREDIAATYTGSGTINKPAVTFNDPAGTTFNYIFNRTAPGFALDTTMHDILLNNEGSLASHAIANYLNSMAFTGYRLTGYDVVGLYCAWVDNTDTFTTSAGTVVTLENIEQNGGLKSFFDQYH